MGVASYPVETGNERVLFLQDGLCALDELKRKTEFVNGIARIVFAIHHRSLDLKFSKQRVRSYYVDHGKFRHKRRTTRC